MLRLHAQADHKEGAIGIRIPLVFSHLRFRQNQVAFDVPWFEPVSGASSSCFTFSISTS